jgi:hypothetical protein
MPLRLAKYGVPLAETAPAGLAAAGIEPALLPPVPDTPEMAAGSHADAAAGGRAVGAAQVGAGGTAQAVQALGEAPRGEQRLELEGNQSPGPQEDTAPDQNQWLHARDPRTVAYNGGYDPAYDPDEEYARWYAEQQHAEQYQDQYQEEPPLQEPSPEETGSFPIPVVPGGRTRELGEGGGNPASDPDEEAYYQVFRQSIDGSYPTPRVLGDNIQATYGTSLNPSELKTLAERFQARHTAELEEDHIA